jgi:DNA-3-methyladenine glycosylase
MVNGPRRISSCAFPHGYTILEPEFYVGRTDVVARRLLGCVLVRVLDDRLSAGRVLAGRIVETEAYFPSGDAACHAHRGMTPRNRVMFEQGGVAYVYFTYGNHYLLNAVTGPAGRPAAVLIRAVEPLEGLEIMRANRPGRRDLDLTSGPGKLTQALAIGKELNGADLTGSPLMIARADAGEARASGAGRAAAPDGGGTGFRIGRSGRIGIRQAQDKLARFYIAGNPYVSVRPRD